MPKRENENPQMRREDYEAMESRPGKDEDGGEFKRASKSAMARRRIVSARRPAKPSGGESTGGSGSNPFSDFSFAPAPATASNFSFATSATKKEDDNQNGKTKTVGFAAGSTPASEKTTGGGFTFGSTPAAKPAGSSTAGATPFVFGGDNKASTPGFSFNSSTGKDKIAGTPKPFSFSPAPAPGPPTTGGFSFGSSTTTATSSGGNTRANRFQKHAVALEKSFYKGCSSLPISTTNILPLLDHYLDFAYCLESEYWKEADTISDPSKPAFAPAPAPASAPAPAPSPSKPALFGFNSAAPAPAPPTPAPVPTPEALGGEPSDTPTDPATKAASSNADEDWETVGESDSPVAFHQNKNVKDEDGKETKKNVCVTKGKPKFQVNKKTKMKRIIMRNDQTGKVLANMALSKELPISYTVNMSSKKHVRGVERVLIPGQITEEHEKGLITLSKAVSNEEHKLETLIKKTLDA